MFNMQKNIGILFRKLRSADSDISRKCSSLVEVQMEKDNQVFHCSR